VGNGIVKPDPERMRALNEFPPPNGYKSLRRVLGIFAYYGKWIGHFSKVRPLAEAKNFPLSGDALNSFKLFKSELANVVLHSIDELAPFVVECDASECGQVSQHRQVFCGTKSLCKNIKSSVGMKLSTLQPFLLATILFG